MILSCINKKQTVFGYSGKINRTEIKRWIELFYDVKVIAMNSHRLPGKDRRMGPIMGHTMHYKCMIITLQPGYSIPPPRKKNKNKQFL
ncbi:hypothetical protein CsSME_00023886 [Camellia sinensis var. sinensis]